MNYRILRLSHLGWRSKPLVAKVVGSVATDLAEAIWHTEALVANPTLEFKVPEAAPLPDFLATGDIFWLISPKTVDHLRSWGVNFDAYPVCLKGAKSGEILRADYHLLHLRQVESIVDLDRSIIKSKVNVKQIQLNNLAAEPKYAFVRDTFLRSLVFVRENLAKAFDQTGITGIYWQRVSEYSIALPESRGG